jgi:TRAP-type mannitol/chloroaromatic compound transport system permease large subunit
MLIVYGATAGVSVVQLYAGALFPGLMLAGLYVVYIVLLAKLKPNLMPPLSMADRFVPLPSGTAQVSQQISNTALPALLRALSGGLKGPANQAVPTGYLLQQLGVALLPLLVFAAATAFSWHMNTRPAEPVATMAPMGSEMAEPAGAEAAEKSSGGGLQEPPSGGLQEPAAAGGGLQEPPAAGASVQEPPASGLQEPGAASAPPSGGLQAPASAVASAAPDAPVAVAERTPPTRGFWIGLGVGALAMVAFYAMLSFQRLEIFKMLLSSFFPLVVLILAVLGSIVMGLATPTEAAAVGAFGGFLLAVAYRQFNLTMLRESVFLTAKTSAMVCWLFVGSAIFSAAFALLGGQELVETWVMSMNLTKTEFLVLSQVIIFILGWPLEWTEIIVIFMPIFIPLLDNFGVDPLFFGLLVALNLQTAFLSPPVAMAAFYLKGVSPPHVTLNQIFAGMLPFMGIQVLAIVLLYQFPAIGLWLPQVLYK